MKTLYIIKAKKIVTVGKKGTILDGAIVVNNGKIIDVGEWKKLKHKYPTIHQVDYSDKILTPSLVDCHTHLLEFAPSSLYPVTKETHFIAGKAILLGALSAGITALGEQICGHPLCDFSIEEYKKIAKQVPLDLSFATTSISIGFDQLAHFTAVTKSSPVIKENLSDPEILKRIATESDYPGENIFINATPANFSVEEVPRAGELIYTQQQLNQIVKMYHQLGKQIGAHVAGEEGISMALEAGVDVLHHAHDISDELIESAAKKKAKVVATPMGGTHLQPNSPSNIFKLVDKGISVSIATDAYLPPHPNTPWLPFQDRQLKGPDMLMTIANAPMKVLHDHGFDENSILALLTSNPAKILNKGDRFGKIEVGMDANFIVADGLPGLEITDVEKITQVYFRGTKVIDRQR